MNKIYFLIGFVFLTVLIYPDENYIIERPSFDLTLSVDEENYWQGTISQSPYIINDNYVQLYPGETLFLEAEVVEDEIIKLSVVREILNENNTIIVEFNQITKEENEKIHNFMMLKIKNPFNKDMEYKADIYLLKYSRWIDTSLIPVRAGLLSYESWPDIIITIVLHDFIFR
jgi:hypothetical protein